MATVRNPIPPFALVRRSEIRSGASLAASQSFKHENFSTPGPIDTAVDTRTASVRTNKGIELLHQERLEQCLGSKCHTEAASTCFERPLCVSLGFVCHQMATSDKMIAPSRYLRRMVRRVFELAYGDYLAMEYLRLTTGQSSGASGNGTQTETPNSDQIAAIYNEMWRKPL